MEFVTPVHAVMMVVAPRSTLRIAAFRTIPAGVRHQPEFAEPGRSVVVQGVWPVRVVPMVIVAALLQLVTYPITRANEYRFCLPGLHPGLLIFGPRGA